MDTQAKSDSNARTGDSGGSSGSSGDDTRRDEDEGKGNKSDSGSSEVR